MHYQPGGRAKCRYWSKQADAKSMASAVYLLPCMGIGILVPLHIRLLIIGYGVSYIDQEYLSNIARHESKKIRYKIITTTLANVYFFLVLWES